MAKRRFWPAIRPRGKTHTEMYQETLCHMDQADFYDIAPAEFRKDAERLCNNIVAYLQHRARSSQP
jgi:hypothetical protein